MTKRFAGVTVLDGVNIDLSAGEIHTIIGENGAGKSTLMKLLAGVHQPDEGRLLLDGNPVTFRTPLDAMRQGIVLIHQEPLNFPDLTVAENVLMANGLPRGRLGQIDWSATHRRVTDLLAALDVPLDPRRKMAGLSIADQQMVELAAALSQNARVLLMDEPTAALTPKEADRLFDLAKRLKQQGVAIVFISHRLPEIFSVSDRITVLRDGRLVGSRVTAATSPEEIIQMMVGREPGAVHSRDSHAPAPGREMLRIEGLTSPGQFADVSFTVRAGEIVGLAGLVGAGRTEVAEALFGVRPWTRGKVFVDGQPVEFAHPAHAMAHGIAYVPEDRARHGLLLPLSVAQNMTLATLADVSSNGFVSAALERSVANKWKDQLGIRLREVSQAAGELSGGNQQKVVFAKWLATRPRIFIVDEPTRGVDVGAKSEMHRLLSDLAVAGNAILMVSSDLPEVLSLSDRVVVMRAGRIVTELNRHKATQESIMLAAAGTERQAGQTFGSNTTSKLRRFATVISRFREVGISAFILLTIILVAMRQPRFLSIDSARSVAMYLPLLLIMAVGQLTVMASRNIDLAIGSTLGLAAMAAGGLFIALPNVPLLAAIALAMAVGLVAGLVNGALVAWLQVPAIIATIGTMTAFRGLIYIASGGRQIDPDELPPALICLSQTGPINIPWIVWIAAITAAIGALFLRYTRSGRAVFAVGSNAKAAALRGIPVNRITLMVFAISGALAGLAGLLFGSRFGTINPASVGSGDELKVISAVVIGGASVNGGSGGVVGTVLGCILLGVIAVALPALRVSEFWQLVVYGMAILSAASLDALLRRARSGSTGGPL